MKRAVVPILVTVSLIGIYQGWGRQKMLQTEFHIAADGSDANEGTRAEPFATLQRAADAGGSPNNGVFMDQGSKGFVIEDNVISDTAGEVVRVNTFSPIGKSQFSMKDALQAGPEDEYRKRHE